MNKQMTISKPLKSILLTIGIIFAIITVIFDSVLFGEASVFNKSISENNIIDGIFHKIPALIRSLQVLIFGIVIYYAIIFLLHLIFGRGNRGITIYKLCCSFLKWVVALATLLFILGAWGIDTTTLLASAGILTLIVGLGAQSLVADIVAGVFIVFEGEFQVGDIVIINNWRGTVQEIGIRTTKVVDVGGNINIINNSEITTLINQTQESSLAKCVIGIEYQESLTKVELIIEKNLDKIKQNIPAIMDGPFYKGVNALSASSVDLLFVAKCKEEDIFQVQRDLNREFKLLFDENNINIPFPQVVLNQPSKTEGAKPTAKEKEQAQKFASREKSVSANLESEENNS